MSASAGYPEAFPGYGSLCWASQQFPVIEVLMLYKPWGTLYLSQRSFFPASLSQDFQKQTPCSPRSFSVKYHSQNELWSLGKKLANFRCETGSRFVVGSECMLDTVWRSYRHDAWCSLWYPWLEVSGRSICLFLLATHAIALDLCTCYLSRIQCPWNLCVLDRTDGAQPISKCVPKMTSSLGPENSWDPVDRDSNESSTSCAMLGKMPPHGSLAPKCILWSWVKYSVHNKIFQIF